MYTLYKKLRAFLLVLCAVYITTVSYLLCKWAPIAFEGAAVHAFTVSLVFISLGMWAYTAYQLWKWKTGSTLSFAEVISTMIGGVMAWQPKRFIATVSAKWNSMLERLVDNGDRTNLLVDTLSMWFMTTLLLYVGMVASSRSSMAFLGALLVFLIVGLIAVNTILHWEAGKYFWRNGKYGYKHNRPTSAN